MHLVYILTRSDVVAGAGIHIRDLSLRLVGEGHRVTVLLGQSAEGPYADELARRGVPFEPLHHMDRAVHPVRDVRAIAELTRALRRLKPDLVSAHTSKAGFVARVAARRVGVPVLYTPHCWAFADGVASGAAHVYRAAEKLAAPLSSRIIMVSENERQEGLEAGIAAPEMLQTIHNGMPDIGADLIADPAQEPPHMVMVARFAEQKDHPTLIRALATLKDLPWTLELIGDGPLMEGIQAQAEAAGLTGRIEFLGRRSDIAERMARAQVFLLITNWEGFSRSILEGMRAGLPIVTTDTGGAPEAVTDGVEGYLVPRGDADALAGRLRPLLADPDQRAAMGAASRAHYETAFRFEVMYAKTKAVYREFVGDEVVV